MVPKIFLTGATGYIGGDILHALYSKHPGYEYTLLVRTQDKGDKLKEKYPNVRIVIANLDNSNVIEEEASKTDIVIHTADASDHEGAARAIATGLSKTHSKENPGFWLHTSGTGILCWEDTRYDRLGEWSDKVYNDWSGIEELTNLPDDAFHRNVDKVVLEAGEKHAASVKTAIICPPTIYGKGRGIFNSRSRQAYEMAKLILTAEYIPIIGKGQARWNNVHVADLTDVFLLLTKMAVSKDVDPELWGEKGYYLTENGEHIWSDLARNMGKKASELGFVKVELKEQNLAKEKALEQAGFEAISWGLNSRGKAERARKLLGWKPHRPSLEDEVGEILKDEKNRIG